MSEIEDNKRQAKFSNFNTPLTYSEYETMTGYRFHIFLLVPHLSSSASFKISEADIMFKGNMAFFR
jgi:hypothetical protein